MLGVLATASNPMPLENLSYFVKLGPPRFDPDDFIMKRVVIVNGAEVGEVSMDRVQDMMVKAIKAKG